MHQLGRIGAATYEYDLARIECFKIVRLWPPGLATHRQRLGRAVAAVLLDQDDDYLVRQYAAGSLGPYTDDAGVFAALAEALTDDPDIDVRHNALSSVEEARASDAGRSLLRRLAGDPELGRASARILREWEQPAE